MLRKFLSSLFKAGRDQAEHASSKQPPPSQAVNLNEHVGITEPICPYCSVDLPKFPGRKTKCKSCGEFMFVRTRPLDKKRILVKESEIPIVAELWAIENGTYDDFCNETDKRKIARAAISRERGGGPISDNDVEWRVLNEELTEHAINRHWGLYRNTCANMYQLLIREKGYQRALPHLATVLYLDQNDPINLALDEDEEDIRETLNLSPEFKGVFRPHFSPEHATYPLPYIQDLADYARSHGLTREEFKATYFAAANQMIRCNNTPLSPEEGWEKIREDVEKYIPE